MACFTPLYANRGGVSPRTGKQSVVIMKRGDLGEVPKHELQLPCGRCIGCRLEYSRQWAMRCWDEARCYEKNCFITLTYDEAQLPEDGSLDKRDFQLFMKRLRKKYGAEIRYFHCGEYGETTGRPHYHACIFNFDFPDRVFHKLSQSGFKVFTSDSLTEIWGKGIAVVGDLTFETAAYVARYVMKKVTGDLAAEHYLIDRDTGLSYASEYVTMSRGGRSWNGKNLGGIGKTFYEKYKDNIFPNDFRVVNGLRVTPPKYYSSQYEISNAADYLDVKERRRRVAMRFADDSLPHRLAVREECKLSQIKKLKRGL